MTSDTNISRLGALLVCTLGAMGCSSGDGSALRSAGQEGTGLAVQPVLSGSNVRVNSPAEDTGTARMQSETSIARNAISGHLCAAFNDSDGMSVGTGGIGFASSGNGGSSFADHGTPPAGSGGPSWADPTLVWRQKDGRFYLSALDSIATMNAGGQGVGIWASPDDCRSFVFAGSIPGAGDKDIMAVDNNASSSYYGRLYDAFTGSGGIVVSHSDDGAVWSTPILVSTTTTSTVSGAWPLVAGGKVYVVWGLSHGNDVTTSFDIEMASSADGGRTFGAVSKVAVNEIYPYAGSCGDFYQGLNGNIRIGPAPQLVVGPDDGCLHIVYNAGPNAFHGTADASDVYYRRSCDGGKSWSASIRVNDDNTATDQWNPTLSVASGGMVSVGFYDRRNDPNNLMYDYYDRISLDNGVHFLPSQRVTPTSSPLYQPDMTSCYHGDYDMQLTASGAVDVLWSDDRPVQSGGAPRADVYFQKITLPAATCTDGARNGRESDVDCGGGTCKACGLGRHCGSNSDCASALCKSGTCQSPSTCSNGKLDGTESDVDCGGSACSPCADAKHCKVPGDCTDGVCTSGRCAAARCTDGSHNGAEADVDCGGSVCAARCGDGSHCVAGSDCQHGSCVLGLCRAPACNDGVLNGSETDVDCGGSCLACANGGHCAADTDCQSSTCRSGTCVCPSTSPTLCGSVCVDTTNDPGNCGACGVVCTGTTTCVAGVCG